MIVPDLDLLIFAYNDASPFHNGARRWWATASGARGACDKIKARTQDPRLPMAAHIC